jgi:predicted nucleotidyltransferase
MKLITEYTFFHNICNLPFVEEVYIYGSRARGTNRERSDFDIAILATQATEKEWIKVLEIVENADTLLGVDCVRLDKIKNEVFRRQILKDGKILYKRKKHDRR